MITLNTAAAATAATHGIGHIVGDVVLPDDRIGRAKANAAPVALG